MSSKRELIKKVKDFYKEVQELQEQQSDLEKAIQKGTARKEEIKTIVEEFSKELNQINTEQPVLIKQHATVFQKKLKLQGFLETMAETFDTTIEKLLEE